MKVANQIALAIAGHAVAQDKIVHSAADINRINLNEAETIKRGGDIGHGRVEQQRTAMKTPGIKMRKTEHSRHICRLAISVAARHSGDREQCCTAIELSHLPSESEVSSPSPPLEERVGERRPFDAAPANSTAVGQC